MGERESFLLYTHKKDLLVGGVVAVIKDHFNKLDLDFDLLAASFQLV